MEGEKFIAWNHDCNCNSIVASLKRSKGLCLPNPQLMDVIQNYVVVFLPLLQQPREAPTVEVGIGRYPLEAV